MGHGLVTAEMLDEEPAVHAGSMREQKSSSLSAPSIMYVIRMYPQTSETFVVNEIRQLERMGTRVAIASCREPVEVVSHRSVEEVTAPIDYGFDPLTHHLFAVAADCVRQLRSSPRRFLATAASAVRLSVGHRRPDLLKRFFQAATVATAARARHVEHLHAQFAHSSAQVAMFAAQMTGLGFSFTAHAHEIFSDDVDHELLGHQIDRARFAVTVSEFNRAFIENATGRRIDVVYNGIDLVQFATADVDDRDPQLVLAVGRLVEKKGFLDLLVAIAALRDRGSDVRCRIIGEGPLHTRLDQEIARLGLADVVTLTGALSQEQVIRAYREAAVVVMPAVCAADGNRDALPTVLLEAMATATPVIGTRVTGIPEIIDHEINGLLVDEGDVAGIGDAIEQLLGDADLRRRMGDAGRAKAERTFDVTTNVGMLAAHFGYACAEEGESR